MQSSLTECEVAQLRASASKACSLLKALANDPAGGAVVTIALPQA